VVLMAWLRDKIEDARAWIAERDTGDLLMGIAAVLVLLYFVTVGVVVKP